MWPLSHTPDTNPETALVYQENPTTKTEFKILQLPNTFFSRLRLSLYSFGIHKTHKEIFLCIGEQYKRFRIFAKCF